MSAKESEARAESRILVGRGSNGRGRRRDGEKNGHSGGRKVDRNNGMDRNNGTLEKQIIIDQNIGWDIANENKSE